jgi:hypothetical protein
MITFCALGSVLILEFAERLGRKGVWGAAKPLIISKVIILTSSVAGQTFGAGAAIVAGPRLLHTPPG